MAVHTREEPIRAAGFVVVRSTKPGASFLLLRNSLRREWGFPKGHLEPGEDTYAGALRELHEETGIDRIELLPGFRQVLRYEVREGRRAGAVKETTYFLGRVDADAGVRLSKEHDDARWCSLEDCMDRLPFESLRGLAREASRFWEDVTA